MGAYRGNNTIGEHKMKRGVALISVLATALMVGLVVGGLYILMQRLFFSSERVAVYSSTREAAEAGIKYTVSQIVGGAFNTLVQGECPTSTRQVAGCCEYAIPYKIGQKDYQNRITVCLAGYQPPPGFEITGVAYSKPTAGGRGYVYTIISEALGPTGSRSVIEAVYVR